MDLPRRTRVAGAQLRAGAIERMRTDVARWPELVRVAIACGLAWLAARASGVPLPVLAPLATLSAVQRTSYGTLREGLRQGVGAVLGALAALVAGVLFGIALWTVALTVLVALLLSRRSTGMQAATTSLLVLALGTHYGHVRIEALLIGTGVGVAVSALTPVSLISRARTALADLADDMARLLGDVAEGVAVPFTEPRAQNWLTRARGLEEALGHARRTTQDARESVRWTPLRQTRHARALDLGDAVDALDHLVGQVRAIARSVADLAAAQQERRAAPPPCLSRSVRDALPATAQALRDYGAALRVDAAAIPLRKHVRSLRQRASAPTRAAASAGHAGLGELAILTECTRILSEVDPAGSHRPWRQRAAAGET